MYWDWIDFQLKLKDKQSKVDMPGQEKNPFYPSIRAAVCLKLKVVKYSNRAVMYSQLRVIAKSKTGKF